MSESGRNCRVSERRCWTSSRRGGFSRKSGFGALFWELAVVAVVWGDWKSWVCSVVVGSVGFFWGSESSGWDGCLSKVISRLVFGYNKLTDMESFCVRKLSGSKF